MVLGGARIERWLEGVDLYKEGWAPAIVISAGPVYPLETDLRARGVRYPREGDLASEAIVSLGVPARAVTVLPKASTTPPRKPPRCAGLSAAHPASSSSRRRTTCGAPDSRFDASSEHRRRNHHARSRYKRSPARWWRRRQDMRYIMTEMPKYAAYLAGLGE